MNIFHEYTTYPQVDYEEAQEIKPGNAKKIAEKLYGISDSAMDEIQNSVVADRSMSTVTRCGFYAMLRMVRSHLNSMLGLVIGLYRNYEEVCAQNNKLIDEIQGLQAQLMGQKESN